MPSYFDCNVNNILCVFIITNNLRLVNRFRSNLLFILTIKILFVYSNKSFYSKECKYKCGKLTT